MKLYLLSTGLDGTEGTKFLKKIIPSKEVAGKKILVISLPEYNTDKLYFNNCVEWGFAGEDIILSNTYNSQEKLVFDFVYVTAGNTFAVLEYLQQKDLLGVIAQIAASGVYIGASAGAILAGKDIRLAADFDENTIGIPKEEQIGLELFDGTILPHQTYTEHRYYLASKPGIVLDRYARILYVSDDEALVLEKIEAEDTWKEKRIRWE